MAAPQYSAARAGVRYTDPNTGEVYVSGDRGQWIPQFSTQTTKKVPTMRDQITSETVTPQTTQETTGLAQEADAKLEEQFANQLIDLDAKLSNLVVSLTDAEKDAYLEKARQQIQPYYDKERERIQQGIKENKIQTAEDLLLEIRNVEETTALQMEELDITKAETEEDFVNTLAEMTRKEGEDLELNRLNWMTKVDASRKEMAQAGYSSDMGGFGTAEYERTKQRRDITQQGIAGEYAAKETALQTEKKYDLERIALARKAAEQKRLRIVGTPEEAEATKKAMTSQAGLSEGQLLSEIEMQRRRAERDIAPVKYGAQQLTDLESQQKQALESRKLELEAQELATRKQASAAELARQRAEAAKQYKSVTGNLWG